MTNHLKLRSLGFIGFLFLAVTLLLAFGARSGTSSSQFTESFTGTPGSPQPFESSDWYIQRHIRGAQNWYRMEPMQAQHGPGCEGPDVTHTVSTYEGMAFLCRDHMMTAINASDYGAIYLSPGDLLDLSSGEAVIRFDVSTYRSSSRDWWDIWVQPWGDAMPMPLHEMFPDLNGPPRNGLVFELSQENVLCAQHFSNGREIQPGLYSGSPSACKWMESYDKVLQPDKARRDTFEIRISRNRVTVSMPDYGLVFHDYRPSTPINWDKAVVQIGHHSYTPWKDGNGGPNTYHWDDFEMSPVVPGALLHADKRYVNGNDQVLKFNGSAPGGSELWFTAMAKNVQLSFDGGPYRPVQPLRTAKSGFTTQFRVPVPAGTSSVAVRAANSDWGEWIARDFAIWSPGNASSPPPRATATPTTPANPTQPVATPTRTTPAQPTATPSPVPTRPSMPTPTPTTAPSGPGWWGWPPSGSPNSSASLSGSVDLEGRSNATGARVSVDNTTAAVGANGQFRLSNLRAYTPLTVRVSMPGYLPASKTVVLRPGQALTLPAVTLKAGDVNGDGRIDAHDLRLISGSLNRPARGALDLDGDGRITRSDIAIALANIGAQAGNW